MADRGPEQDVARHYGRVDVAAAILDGLRAAGKNLDALTPDDLAPFDQLHSRGKAATLELIELAGLRGGERVLDVGGGLGGSARLLAAEPGCQVVVLDLTEAFCRAGERLTELTGLSDRVTFRHGSALDLPFDDASFDVVWTQHSSMNITDKERLYAEIRRVLRPGGTLALHEIMAGPVQPVLYPVAWAEDPSISFLRPPEEIRALLGNLGFAERAWVDATADTIPWAQQRAVSFANARSGTTPPGLPALLGPVAVQIAQNQARNLAEQRVVVIEAVLTR